MKNKLLLLTAVAISLALTQTSNASIVSILNLDPAAGTYGDFTASISGGPKTVTISFTNGGATDLDGGGTNDTLAFDMVYELYFDSSYTGTSPNATVTLGTAANPTATGQNWGVGNFSGGRTLSLLVQNINYTSGEADGTTAVFDGFTGIRKIDNGAGAVDLAIGGITGATIVTVGYRYCYGVYAKKRGCLKTGVLLNKH
jgi:hypothetical protein